MPPHARKGSSTSTGVAEKVRSILASKRLTLYRASQQSVALYGLSSPYFLPHHLYYDLGTGSFRPSIHQIFALSRISGYRVADWLRVFGFDLEDITRLQILLPSKRTIFSIPRSPTQTNGYPGFAIDRSANLFHRSHHSHGFWSWGPESKSPQCHNSTGISFMPRSELKMLLRFQTSPPGASCA